MGVTQLCDLLVVWSHQRLQSRSLACICACQTVATGQKFAQDRELSEESRMKSSCFTQKPKKECVRR